MESYSTKTRLAQPCLEHPTPNTQNKISSNQSIQESMIQMAQGWKYVTVYDYKTKLGRQNYSQNSNLVAFHECSKHIVHLILESHVCPHLHIRYLAGTSVWNFWTHLLSIRHNEGWETCINIRPKCPLQGNKLKVHKLEKKIVEYILCWFTKRCKLGMVLEKSILFMLFVTWFILGATTRLGSLHDVPPPLGF